MRTSRYVAAGAAVAAIAVLAQAGLGLAAREPTPAETSQIGERAIAWLICCVDTENGAVKDVRISTTHGRYGRADMTIVYPGSKVVNAIVVLKKGPFGWKVLEGGTHALGCETVPQRARVDLGLAGRGVCVRTNG